MTAPGDLAYALARLQARFGARPDETDWRALEASHTAAQFLQLTRAGTLARWTEGLPDAADTARTERHLHTRWQRHVSEVAAWLPPRWRPSTLAFGRLPALPLRADDAAACLAAWRADWARALPPEAAARRPWRRPAELLLPRLAAADGARGVAAETQQQALVRLFRRHAGTALMVFAYLALVALDLERLRGGLVRRALFEAEAA
jgi:hypothetical protein